MRKRWMGGKRSHTQRLGSNGKVKSGADKVEHPELKEICINKIWQYIVWETQKRHHKKWTCPGKPDKNKQKWSKGVGYAPWGLPLQNIQSAPAEKKRWIYILPQRGPKKYLSEWSLLGSFEMYLERGRLVWEALGQHPEHGGWGKGVGIGQREHSLEHKLNGED